MHLHILNETKFTKKPIGKEKNIVRKVPLSLFQFSIQKIVRSEEIDQKIFHLPLDILSIILDEFDRQNRIDFWILLLLLTSGRYISTLSIHLSKPINDVVSILRSGRISTSIQLDGLTTIDFSRCRFRFLLLFLIH